MEAVQWKREQTAQYSSSRVSRGERKKDAVLNLIHSKLEDSFEDSFEHKEIDPCHLS